MTEIERLALAGQQARSHLSMAPRGIAVITQGELDLAFLRGALEAMKTVSEETIDVAVRNNHGGGYTFIPAFKAMLDSILGDEER